MVIHTVEGKTDKALPTGTESLSRRDILKVLITVRILNLQTVIRIVKSMGECSRSPGSVEGKGVKAVKGHFHEESQRKSIAK